MTPGSDRRPTDELSEVADDQERRRPVALAIRDTHQTSMSSVLCAQIPLKKSLFDCGQRSVVIH
jgi:hypothetical protein